MSKVGRTGTGPRVDEGVVVPGLYFLQKSESNSPPLVIASQNACGL